MRQRVGERKTERGRRERQTDKYGKERERQRERKEREEEVLCCIMIFLRLAVQSFDLWDPVDHGL